MTVEVREITSRAEWLLWRRGVITASRIGALFDAHPYLSREQLAAELRGGNQGDNPAMRAGRILEPGILVAICEEHPDWIVKSATTFHVDPALRLGCTPDAWFSKAVRYVHDWLEMDGIIQAGAVSEEVWDKSHGKPPFYKTLQTLVEMMLTGKQRGILAIMVRSRSLPLYEFEVSRHPEAEARILVAVAEWWRAWDAGEIAQPADAAGLDTMLDDGSSIDLSADNEVRQLLDDRMAWRNVAKAYSEQADEADAKIKAKIGAARSAWLPGWRLSWPTIHAKEYTVAARDYRRLTIKRTEE